MTEILVHLPDPLEQRVLPRSSTPRIGEEFPKGFAVVRRRFVDDNDDTERYTCEVWVEPVNRESPTLDDRSSTALSADVVALELVGLLRDAGLDGHAERLEDARQRNVDLSTVERDAILNDLRAVTPTRQQT